MAPLIIGEAPNRAEHEGRGSGQALDAPVIVRRLPGILELERVNLLSRWPGPDPRGKGSLFPMDKARRAASRLWARHPHTTPFVIVSVRAAEAFGIRRSTYEFLQWFDYDGRGIAVVPHPSGLLGAGRWWNLPGNAEAAAQFFRSLRAQPPGSYN